MAPKKKKEKRGFVGTVHLFDRSEKSEIFGEKGDAEKWVQSMLTSDFVWVDDCYGSVLHANGEVKKA